MLSKKQSMNLGSMAAGSSHSRYQSLCLRQKKCGDVVLLILASSCEAPSPGNRRTGCRSGGLSGRNPSSPSYPRTATVRQDERMKSKDSHRNLMLVIPTTGCKEQADVHRQILLFISRDLIGRGSVPDTPEQTHKSRHSHTPLTTQKHAHPEITQSIVLTAGNRMAVRTHPEVHGLMHPFPCPFRQFLSMSISFLLPTQV